MLPHGKDKFRAACPFCALPLDGPKGFVKLIFQTQVDENSRNNEMFF